MKINNSCRFGQAAPSRQQPGAHWFMLRDDCATRHQKCSREFLRRRHGHSVTRKYNENRYPSIACWPAFSDKVKMPRAFAAETTIAKPAHDVWQALTDWSNAHRWMAGVDWLKADGETAQGTRITFRARDHDRTSTIIACQPGRSLVLHSEQGGVSADYEYGPRGGWRQHHPGHADRRLPHARPAVADPGAADSDGHEEVRRRPAGSSETGHRERAVAGCERSSGGQPEHAAQLL